MSGHVDYIGDCLNAGVLLDRRRAIEARGALLEIGKRVDLINSAGFGPFFGLVQDALSDKYVLAINRIFENPSDKYPTRCLEALLRYVQENAAEIPLQDESPLREAFPSQAPDTPRLLRDFVRQAGARLPPSNPEISEAFTSLKTLRSKCVAHNEAFDASQVYHVEWAESDKLLEIAGSIAYPLAEALLDTVYTSKPIDPERSEGAFHTQRLLSRLLSETAA